MAELDRLRTEVAETTTVAQSAITLLRGLKAKLDAAIGNDAALKALADELDAKTNELSAAIVENTPAEEEPPT